MEKLTQDELIRKWALHGQEVNSWYKKLTANPDLIQCPAARSWFEKYQPIDLATYHLNHDISKPFCARFEDGRYHYGSDHSDQSALLYEQQNGKDRFSQMIRNDMKFHTAKADSIDQVWSLPDAEHLYATSWAELFANAQSFGGTDSESFKIKQKRLIWALNKKGKNYAK